MPQFRYFGSNNKTVMRTATFVAVVVGILLLLRIPVLSRFSVRVQASVVRLATGFGSLLTRVTQPENTVMAQYQVCQADRLALAVDQSEHQALRRQLDELAQLLDYRTKSGATGTVTHVLSRSIDNDATLIVIDRGEVDGVVVGSAVVIGDGIVYGQVIDVRAQTAIVQLVSHPDSKIPAAILGQTRTIGLVEGREGALLTMEFIPQDAQLGTGNLVVTSGLDGLVPEGLVIGLVTEVVSVESAPFQRAFIELLYEPREWTTALILPPPGI
jgi:rod shape-determining protein MreC